MASSIYSRFRSWQEEGVGAEIFDNEKEMVETLVQRLKPSLVVQVEGRALLDHVSEDMMYYYVSEDSDIVASGFTVEAEQGFMPFPDRSVDLLLLSHALELYQHPVTILAECERVLADDGCIFLMVLTSSWLEGNIPTEFHPLGNLKIMSISTRKLKEWVQKTEMAVQKEHSFALGESFLLSGRLSDMIIHPAGYEIKRVEVAWNGLVGVVE